MSSSHKLQQSASAQWSLIFGILSIAACWIFTSIPAIVLGCVALGKTSGPNPEKSGHGIAKAGILTGCIGTIIGLFSMGIWLVLLDPAEPSFQQRVGAQSAEAELHEISSALRTYSITEGTYPKSLQQLVPLFLPTWESLAPYGSGSDQAPRYRYRLEGFRSNDLGTSPIVLTPQPIEGENYGVIFADGQVGRTSDPSIIDLFD